ncbi:Armadillo-like helical domain containing protein [Gracilaria domingensis]|nr:Armadillo-like helical domain containing protein [Gracilaria domingensis]
MQSFSRLTRTAACSLVRHARRSSLNSNRSRNGPSSATPAIAVLTATATATVGVFAYCDADTAVSPSPPPTFLSSTPAHLGTQHEGSMFSLEKSLPSQYSALLEEVSQGDARAIHTLALLVNDIHNHSELLKANVVSALRDALFVCEKEHELPLRLNVVRLLADLAKQNESHDFFVKADIVSILDRIVAESAAGMREGWVEWFYRYFSFGSIKETENLSNVTKDKNSPFGEPSTAGEAVVDYLNVDLKVSSKPLDVQNGLAYNVTRCVANLARDTETHDSLLETSLLRNLCDMLRQFTPKDLGEDELQSETARHTILAVSALSKSAAEPVIRSNAHKALIKFAQCDDVLAQTYSCGGLRNLARHDHLQQHEDIAKVHRELVVSNVADALNNGMRAASAQTKVFCVLAFGDLMSTPHPKADLIRKRLEPTYQAFSQLLTDKNVAISRVVSRVIVTMFGEEGGRSVVPDKLAMLIAAESGQLVNGGVARGDRAALNAVRAMCNDQIVAKEMVDKGLLEVLILGVRKGNSDFLHQCTAALSSLSAWSDLSPFIISRGALTAVMRRPSMEQDGRYVAAFLANLARNADLQVEIAHGGIKTLLVALSSKNDDARKEAARALYNLSLGGVTKVMVAQSGALIPLVNVVSTMRGDARRYAVSVLTDISSAQERATEFAEANVIGSLLKAAEDDYTLSCDVARCISQLSQVAEVHGLLVKSGAVPWLINLISRNGGRGERAGDTMLYCMVAVNNIAFSPGITREALRKSGAIPLLKSLSSSGMSSPIVLMGAKQGLQNMRGEKAALLPAENVTPPGEPE